MEGRGVGESRKRGGVVEGAAPSAAATQSGESPFEVGTSSFLHCEHRGVNRITTAQGRPAAACGRVRK
jgi:hypothetical protein